MLSCKEAAKLVSENLDRKLPFWRRVSLRLHLAMCSTCAAYRRQIEVLNRLVTTRYRFGAPQRDTDRLSDDRIAQIKAALRAD